MLAPLGPLSISTAARSQRGAWTGSETGLALRPPAHRDGSVQDPYRGCGRGWNNYVHSARVASSRAKRLAEGRVQRHDGTTEAIGP